MKTDEPSFDRLFARYSEGPYRYCRRIMRDRSDAEDLFQDTLVAAYRQLGSFRGEATEKTWLYRIATLRARRLRTRQRLLALWLPRPEAPEDPSSRIAICEAIEALPDRHRSAFVLVKLEVFTCDEAAQILEVPSGTVKYWIQEALTALQKKLKTTVRTHDEEATHAL